MMNCISVANMRLSDAQTIEKEVPGLELMYRAAYGIYLALPRRQGKVGIVVGSGNNGGDGFALACILQAHGIPCCVFTVTDKFSPDSRYYADRAADAGVSIIALEEGVLNKYDIIVDCLLGTGFQGGLRDSYRNAILQINSSGGFVVSADINSGLNGDTGEAELAVYSDLTVTIGYVKKGLITENAGRFMKKLVCADIGIRLAYEEDYICDSSEPVQQVSPDHRILPCPAWLDMNVIYVK